MSDRHICKAKRIDNGEWVEGYCLSKVQYIEILGAKDISVYHYIIPEGGPYSENMTLKDICIEVNPETVCQCTGLTDKNGKKIFENDIVKCGEKLVVTWKEKLASFCLSKKGWLYQHFFGEAVNAEDVEVIGSIIDNPELLEGGAE